MAAAVGMCGHRSKRVGPHRACSGYLGAAVERPKSLRPVRQHGRCVCCKQEISLQSDPLQATTSALPLLFYDITLVARHLPGVSNAAADALSRDNLPLFMSLNPQASPMPTVISAALQDMLFNEQISMNSLTWTTRLRDSLEAASLTPLAQHTPAPCECTSASASSSTRSGNST